MLSGAKVKATTGRAREEAEDQTLAASRFMPPSVTASSSTSTWIRFSMLQEAAEHLMLDMAATVERQLGPLLLQSRTPSDVAYFKNVKDTAQGSVVLRAGVDPGQVSFALGSWLHCKLTAGTLSIATIIVMLGPHIDAPHFMLEFIQNDCNSIVLLLDLLPRKDVVLEPEYLRRFYEDTDMEKLRKSLDKVPQSKKYVPNSLYIRSVVSPTALLYKFKSHVKITGAEADSIQARKAELDALVKEVIHPTTKEALSKWVDAFRNKGQRVEGEGSKRLLERDIQIREKGVEIDLSTNMPKLFGHTITNRVVQAYRNGV